MKDLVVSNCKVLSTSDDSHVTRMTPIQIKRKELAEARSYLDPQEKTQMEQNVPKREKGPTRPLGGRE